MAGKGSHPMINVLILYSIVSTFVSVSPVLWPLLKFSADIVLEQIYPSQNDSQGWG